MQHFVLTRLALGRPSSEWLAKRIVIFEKYCAASVRSQTERDFKWFLALNPNIPDWFTKRVVAAAPDAVLAYHNGPRDQVNWRKLIEPFIRSGRLVTTRLDNDDMLHKDFIAIVRHAARSSRLDFVIDFPVGYQLRLSDLQCRTFVRSAPTHFLSLVEAGIHRQLAYCQQHQKMGALFPILRIEGAPIWVEICHSSNLQNSFPENACCFSWQTVRHLFV
jgi:Putative rhamnosyl transferase